MYLIVLGAGPVGLSLIELALKDGHNVALIESDAERAQAASERYDCLVLHADIAQGGILEEAGAERADALVAVTSDDSANLMAMFLGVEHRIQTLISVVNDRRHQGLFQRLGVHVLVDPEIIVAQHLYGVLRQPQAEDVVALAGGAEVVQLTLGERSPLAGKRLAQAGEEKLLPGDLLIVSIKRGSQTVIPSGSTALEVGDRLTLFAQHPLSRAELERFTG